MGLTVHLVDGTYELFRHHFAVPSHLTDDGREVGAVRGVLRSVLSLIEGGATHIGVATDHVVESFRNDLWPGYKTSEGMPEELLAQFVPLEEALTALGVVVWPMVEHEADDALASAAAVASADERVEQVLICTADKDLAQCVDGTRVVQLDRRKRLVVDEAGVIERFGVPPSSIPDYLALVGDSADGFPGLAGWGAKSSAKVLARYGHIEDIPDDPTTWDGVSVRGMGTLAATLAAQRDLALLFRHIATVDCDAPTIDGVDELRWRGPEPGAEAVLDQLDASAVLEQARALAKR